MNQGGMLVVETTAIGHEHHAAPELSRLVEIAQGIQGT